MYLLSPLTYFKSTTSCMSINSVLRFLFFCLLFSGITSSLLAQYTLKGRVLDKKTKEPMSFVTVTVAQTGKGAYTDVEGRFTLQLTEKPGKIIFSFVGYEKQEVIPGDNKELTVWMMPAMYMLQELVVMPGENPAHRIINLAIENRKINNPEKATSFSYTSYNKLIFTGLVDSALLNNPEKLAALDSSDKMTIDFFEKQHILLSESVTERKFIPPARNQEKVIANRVSGLSNPVFSLIGTQLQSFSFYNDYISLLDYKYLSPLASGSTSKYLFLLEDTLYDGKDSIFVISFRPRTRKNFDGMSGLLYKHTDGYALKNEKAQPAEAKGGVQISIRQQYEKVQGKQWFPVQLNSSLLFDNMQVNNFKVAGIGWAYIKDIQLAPDIKRREIKNVEFEVLPSAHKVDETFWQMHRPDSLTKQELETYRVIDSLGKAENLDLKLKSLLALYKGRIQTGPLDVELDKILRYNGYEKLRVGLGLRTNDKIFKHAQLGGYFGYGFGDKEWKFGGDLNVFIAPTIDMELNLSYIEDVIESGGASFYRSRLPLNTTESYRQLFINRMDRIYKSEAVLSFRFLRYFKMNLFANEQTREVTNPYFFDISLPDETDYLKYVYQFYETGVDARFAFKEKLAKTPLGTFPIPGKYPVFRLRYATGLRNNRQDVYYNRIDLRAVKHFFIRHVGRSSFTFMGGYINGEVPFTLLYNARGTYENFSISVNNTFETMRPNEFLSNRYASLHYMHSFGSLLFKSKFMQPRISVSASAGWGELNNAGKHRNISFQTMEKGYYESGLIIDNILKLNFTGLGIGAFYRIGSYAFPDAKDNVVLKASFSFVF